MSTFFRGPVCGTDNCRSRLWRIIDGRRTCQYGHVMEGDVEFNNDDDDFNSQGVVTRRLNLTTSVTGSFRSSMNSQSQLSQRDSANQKIYGIEGDKLFLKCFQHVLKLQCNWLVEQQSFPPIFKDVVKLMWMRYLKWLEGSSAGDAKNAESSARGKGRLGLSALSSVCLLYMASTHLRLPVYWFDYLRWICSMKLAYFKANLQLPTQWRRQLPNYYLQALEGGKTPAEGQFFHKLAQMCFTVQVSSTFNTLVSYEALVVKILFLLKLPPHTFFDVQELIRIAGEDEQSFVLIERRSGRVDPLHLCAEIRIVAYLVLSVRYKILQNDPFLTKYYAAWLEFDFHDTGAIATDDLVTQLSRDVGPENHNYYKWDKTKTADYLDWLENHFLPVSTSIDAEIHSFDQKIANRKLHALFPLHRDDPARPTTAAKSSTFVERAQEAYLELSDALAHSAFPHAPTQLSDLAYAVHLRLLHHLSSHFALSQSQLHDCLNHLQIRCRLQPNSSPI